ncbi:site-specific DNA-methyltransferase [Corynebacterium timonense]|uniref:Site-specific DNA-methyltransferase (Adenine-specific) n=1 Tax=Corynebacterium timonense TaxID=441500 RepID=A0A1H1R8Z9_9CORY|nr:site-specific DNA-methyltransferase [Corynebacterium timonense]SDS32274.1 site-specific DNA-methyltransferase (adenine-specific) [Corynebacterium timonense]
MGRQQRLELTWTNKDKALIPTEQGRYGYTWVDPRDPRYCETRVLTVDETVTGTRADKEDGTTYSERADLTPQTDNLLILGESGDVLEALTRVPEWSEKYVSKVKCIYIDPPFNTAQTFANYEDNLEHSVWLTMMRDRLLHLRDLLNEDGSIWVHLDYAENHRMRTLLDEVFGAGNFLSEFVWQKADGPRNDATYFSTDQDVIIAYRKTDNFSVNRLPRPAWMNTRFSNPDNDPKGPWAMGDPCAPDAPNNQPMVYAIQHPITGDLMYPSQGSCWRMSPATVFVEMNKWAPYEMRDIGDREKRAAVSGVRVSEAQDVVPALMLTEPLEESTRRVREKIDSGETMPELVFTRNGLGRLMRKARIPSGGVVPRTLLLNEQVSHSRGAKKEIVALFPGTTAFATPKPERLLERIIHIATNPGDVVLDVFAGSGTTAAVAQKMGRRWVTCELVEDTFNRFTRPRLEKVINNEDQGGITIQKEERADATEDGLPEGLTPEEAQKFTSLLNKTIKNDDELKKNPAVKQLKAMTKTKPVKGVVNWRGGGGFQVAHLEPACFDYDPEIALTTLTEHATGDLLVRSVAAQLRFALTPSDLHFDGERGREHLVVVEGVLDEEKVSEVMAHLPEGHSVVFAATVVDESAREHVRSFKNGSRVVHVPLEIFPYSDTADEEK